MDIHVSDQLNQNKLAGTHAVITRGTHICQTYHSKESVIHNKNSNYTFILIIQLIYSTIYVFSSIY